MKKQENEETRYSGRLVLYYETGYEGMQMPILQDFKGIKSNPNYKKDSKNYLEFTKEFYDLKESHFFKKSNNYQITIVDKNNKNVYQGPLTYKGYTDNVAFIPKEIKLSDWLKYLDEEYEAHLTVIPKLTKEIANKLVTLSLVATQEQIDQLWGNIAENGWKLTHQGNSGTWIGEPIYKVDKKPKK